MRTEGKVWLIYNSESAIQSQPMSLAQVQAVLLSIPPDQQINYFIWTPGWSDWQNVEDYLSTEQSYFAQVRPPIPTDANSTGHDATIVTETQRTELQVEVTESSPSTDYTEVFSGSQDKSGISTNDFFAKDFNGDDLDLSKIKKIKPPTTSFNNEPLKSNRREHPRMNFKIEVVLISDLGSFRTCSRDISLTGTQLEDEVPLHFFKTGFDIVLVNPFEPDKTKARLLFKAKIVSNIKDRRRLMFVETDREMTLRLDALLKAYVTYQEQMKKNNRPA